MDSVVAMTLVLDDDTKAVRGTVTKDSDEEGEPPWHGDANVTGMWTLSD